MSDCLNNKVSEKGQVDKKGIELQKWYIYIFKEYAKNTPPPFSPIFTAG